jgi:hypothetical protein
MNTWTKQELRFLDLGDKRLVRRTVQLVEALAARPEASVPQATVTWPATKAAYRFWDNDGVDPEALYQAQRDSVLARLPAVGPLLALQDTTDFNFTAHPRTRDLGYLGRATQHGLWVHSTLLADGDGVPLGLLHQHVWTRDPAELGKRKDRDRKETAAKESQRWLDAQAATHRALPPGRPVLTVADREADFYDLFAAPRASYQHLLIRARPRRRVRHELRLLGAAVAASPARGQMTVAVSRQPGRPARQATLTLRFLEVILEPPANHPRRQQLRPLPLTAVLAVEENPPPGQPPLRWLLLTTLPVPDFAAAVEVVRWYSRRWLVERYHYTLKSGCRIEQLQLETAARLRRALATYTLVAWRLLWLTYEARMHQELPCSSVLQAEEWQVLQRQFPAEAVAETDLPTLGQAVRLIARLGGFLARRHDGEPGVQVLWRGLRRLEDLVTGWRLAQAHAPPIVGNA